MDALCLRLTADRCKICRCAPDAVIPESIWDADGVVSVTRTPDEISIVISETVDIAADRVEVGWRCFAVEGPLDFAMTGVLAELSGALAAAEIALFAISTFDTDYIFVKQADAAGATAAFRRIGVIVM
ncbi:MAG: ACT domain-containing protein [Pseudomonadota bacterium]